MVGCEHDAWAKDRRAGKRLLHDEFPATPRADVRGLRCGIGADARDMDKPADALSCACLGYIARAVHVNGCIGGATLLHIRRNSIDDALDASDGWNHRLFVADVRGYWNRSSRTSKSGTRIDLLRVTHCHLDRHALPSEALNDAAAEKARTAKDGHERHRGDPPLTNISELGEQERDRSDGISCLRRSPDVGPSRAMAINRSVLGTPRKMMLSGE